MCVLMTLQGSPCRPHPQVSCNGEDSAVQEHIFLPWLVPSLHFLISDGTLDLINHWGQFLEAQCLQWQVE